MMAGLVAHAEEKDAKNEVMNPKANGINQI